MGVKLKKKAKAKPSPKSGKLLAQFKKMAGQAFTKKLQAQMESLPQVEVLVKSTSIKCKLKSLGTIGSIFKKHQEAKPNPPLSGSFQHTPHEEVLKEFGVPDEQQITGDVADVLKKWQKDVDVHQAMQVFSGLPSAEQAHFIEILKKGSEEIHANTVHDSYNFLDMSPEAWEAFKSVMEEKLTEIAGMSTLAGTAVLAKEKPDCVYLALVDPEVSADDILGCEFVMKQGAVPNSLMLNSVQTVIKARFTAEIHHDLMVHALAGTKLVDLVEPVPVRKKGEEAEDYRARLRTWWDVARIHFCALAAEVRGIEFEVKKLVGFKADLEKHPEAAGVGPLGSVGIVQTMAPFSATSNKIAYVCPEEVGAAKKLQPKFSKEAEADAKEQGLGATAEDIVSGHTELPGFMPGMEINIVVENGEPFLVTTCAGKVLEKSPAVVSDLKGPDIGVWSGPAVVTQKGHETLNRFGVVLKGTP